MKKCLFGIVTIFFCSISVYALSSSFKIDKDSILTSSKSKNTEIASKFNASYQIKYETNEVDESLIKEITTLTKKTTYLLLGKENNISETAENYSARKQEYLNLRYNPKVPKDESNFIGLDTNSQEYKDDLLSGWTIPGMFNQLADLEIVYSKFGDIRVRKVDDGIVSSIVIPNVKMVQANQDEPMEFDTIHTNLTLYFYYKELNGEYKLYYLMGETDDDLEEYFEEVKTSENQGLKSLAYTYDSSLNDLYDFSKLNNLTAAETGNIYDKNINQVVILNTYYNNSIVNTAGGYFLSNGVVVTTWNFIEKSLLNGEKIVIRDNKEQVYNVEGIITIDATANVALLKVTNSSQTGVIFGDYKKLVKEDPIFTISSKTGVGLSIQSGIIITTDNEIQSLLPLTEKDEGSPLININGEVIGINTSDSINTSVSIAKNVEALTKLQDKLKNTKYEDIDCISFSDLKEEYYYTKRNKEIISNNIKSKIWKEYSKIGNIENSINLNLLKASYKNNTLSLRYSNNISNYISSMQLATSFKSELISNNYKEILDSKNKAIYENGKYKVIIMDEFNYLIIVMVKL